MSKEGMNRKGARNRIIACMDLFLTKNNLYLLDTKIERVMDIVKRDQFIALWKNILMTRSTSCWHSIIQRKIITPRS